MMWRIARDPRVKKLRDWRRNRWRGARHQGRSWWRERSWCGGRPWEGRGQIEADRQRVTLRQAFGLLAEVENRDGKAMDRALEALRRGLEE